MSFKKHIPRSGDTGDTPPPFFRVANRKKENEERKEEFQSRNY